MNDINDDELNDYTDFSVNKIEMTKESAELIKLIRKNLCELFNRDVSLAETINRKLQDIQLSFYSNLPFESILRLSNSGKPPLLPPI